MLLKLSVIILLVVLGNLHEVQSATCTFVLLQSNYVCRLEFQTIDSENDMQVSGVHLEGFSNNNVTSLTGGWSTVQVFPSLIIDQFVNLRSVTLDGTSMRLFNSPTSNCASLDFVVVNGNFITSIPEGIFRNCANLRSLLIASNNVTRIHINAFVGLTNLEVLSLSGNQITDLSFEWFLPLTSLAALNLSWNQLASWNATILASNSKIVSLELSNNQIRSLDSMVFTNLPNLQFVSVGSLIEELPTFQNVPQLEVLWLNNNRLKTVSSSHFRNMGNLKRLQLQNNQIENINFTKVEEKILNNLEELILSFNNIKNLPNNVFSSLESLNRLELFNNQIEMLSASSFHPISQLRMLEVSRNRIRRIEREMFDNVTRLQFRAGGNVCINHEITIFEGGLSTHDKSLLEQCFNTAPSLKLNGLVLISVMTFLFWTL